MKSSLGSWEEFVRLAESAAELPKVTPTPRPTPTTSRVVLPFVSAAELCAHTPAEPDWVWEGYLVPRAVTILAKKPKAGGSTLSVAIAEAVASGAASFLGRKVSGGPVLYLSEEGAASLAHKLPALENLLVLPREAAWPKPRWTDLLAGSAEESKRIGAVLLIVDSFSFWAALPRDAEKDAGAVQAAMEPLLNAASTGPAVLLDAHSRKGGGEDGEGLRGSSALAGAVDIILELERTSRPRERALLALSRYPSTPGSLVVNQDAATGAWAVIGEGAREDARAMSDRQSILDALGGSALTRDELEDAMGSPERQWHATLTALITEGEVQRIGEGKRGSPYKFLRNNTAAQKRAETDSLSAHPLRDAERNLSAQQKPAQLSAQKHDGGWSDAELQSLVDSYEEPNGGGRS
jgi:hypothetical protein